MATKAVPPRTPRAADEVQEPTIGAGTAALIFFGLSVLYFFPAFLPDRHIFGTDYLAGGYFFYDFVSARLAEWELPKWVPYLYGGLPLHANPGSTFYPVRLFADLLFPVTWILPFIFVFQFGMAGVGMYLLARELECRPWISFVAGLAFQFTGITLSAVYGGHDGRVIVATFAPLFFYFLHRGIRTGALAPFVGAAATCGASLLSFQIQSNYYLLLAGAIWAVFSLVHLGFARHPGLLGRRVGFGLAAVAFGFLLAAVNFLPFLDYVPESPRGGEGGRGYEYSISWSMPPAELLSVAVPEGPGILENYQGENPFKLHTEYVGAFVLVLLVLGFRFARGNRYWWFFGALAAFTLTIAFGGHTPLYRLYYALLPGTARFRAPSISFFLFALSLVTMAAITLEAIVAQREGRRPRGTSRRGENAGPGESLGLWLAVVTGGALLGVMLAAVVSDGTPRDAAMVSGFGRFFLFTGLTCGTIWLWWSDRIRTAVFAVLLSIVTLVDLWIVGRNFFETVPPPEVTFAPDDVVYFLRGQATSDRDRVWVLPVPAGSAYRGHGNYLMLFGIEQASGEHGNQLQRYNEFLGAGTDVYVDYSNFLEHVNFMRAANIRYIVSMVELQTPFLREVHRGSALVYENLLALPRAYLVGNVVVTADSTAALRLIADPDFDVATSAVIYGDEALELPDGELAGQVEITEWTPDRVVIQVEVNRPALLVHADNYFPGWRATVNGHETTILRTNHTFRGVPVAAGSSEVVLDYRPTDLRIGFFIYLAALATLLAYAVWLGVARRRTSTSAAEAA